MKKRFATQEEIEIFKKNLGESDVDENNSFVIHETTDGYNVVFHNYFKKKKNGELDIVPDCFIMLDDGRLYWDAIGDEITQKGIERFIKLTQAKA